MRSRYTVGAILVSAVVWFCFKLPLLWIFGVQEIDCTHIAKDIGKMLVLNMGEFHKRHALKNTMYYLWAAAGFFIPVAVLGYCNYRLLLSLRISRQLRYSTDVRSRLVNYDPHRRISITLVCIVVMFFLLVCPSEILQFYTNTGKILLSFLNETIPGNACMAASFKL